MTYEELKEFVRKVTSLRLGDKKPDDELFSYYFEEVEQTILNYIHHKQIPYSVRFTWINILVDYLTWISENKDSSVTGVVSSIKEGDTTVTLSGTGTSPQKARQKLADDFILNYTQQLNEVRCFNWGGVPHEHV